MHAITFSKAVHWAIFSDQFWSLYLMFDTPDVAGCGPKGRKKCELCPVTYFLKKTLDGFKIPTMKKFSMFTTVFMTLFF